MRLLLNTTDSLEIARSIVTALEDRKGEDIVLMDIQGIAFFADYFVLCNGTSDRMLRSLAEGALEQVKKTYRVNGRVEGRPEDGWLVVDFGDIVLHLFDPEQRDYYRLEELWEEARVLLRVQ